MIDWVSIVRHSRRRFSNYVGARAPIRIKKRRQSPNPTHVAHCTKTTPLYSPQDDRLYCNCCCTHVSIFICVRDGYNNLKIKTFFDFFFTFTML